MQGLTLAVWLLAVPSVAGGADFEAGLAGLVTRLAEATQRHHLATIAVVPVAVGAASSESAAAGQFLASEIAARLKTARPELVLMPAEAVETALSELAAKPERPQPSDVVPALRAARPDLSAVLTVTVAVQADRVAANADLWTTSVDRPLASCGETWPATPDLLALLGRGYAVATERGLRPKLAETVAAAALTGPEIVPAVLRPDCPFRLELLFDGAVRRPLPRLGVAEVAARQGETFQIRLTNGSAERIGVALLVDGRNSIRQGRQTPSAGPKWIVPPHDSLVVPGWQLDETTSAQFTFGRLGQATGQEPRDQLGWITASFFAEGEAPAVGEVRDRDLEELFVDQGARTQHAVRTVTFQAAEYPAATLVIRYVAARQAPQVAPGG